MVSETSVKIILLLYHVLFHGGIHVHGYASLAFFGLAVAALAWLIIQVFVVELKSFKAAKSPGGDQTSLSISPALLGERKISTSSLDEGQRISSGTNVARGGPNDHISPLESSREQEGSIDSLQSYKSGINDPLRTAASRVSLDSLSVSEETTSDLDSSDDDGRGRSVSAKNPADGELYIPPIFHRKQREPKKESQGYWEVACGCSCKRCCQYISESDEEPVPPRGSTNRVVVASVHATAATPPTPRRKPVKAVKYARPKNQGTYGVKRQGECDGLETLEVNIDCTPKREQKAKSERKRKVMKHLKNIKGKLKRGKDNLKRVLFSCTCCTRERIDFSLAGLDTDFDFDF